MPLPPAFSWSKRGPNVVISDSSFGYMRYSARQRGVAEFVSAVPTLKSERGWHGLFDGVVGRAELPTIWRTLDDYVSLCGAGYQEDGTVLVVPHDRVVAIFWSLNDVCGGRGKWAYKMEHLSEDVLNLARLSHFAGPVISSLAVPPRLGTFLFSSTPRATQSSRYCVMLVARRTVGNPCFWTCLGIDT